MMIEPRSLLKLTLASALLSASSWINAAELLKIDTTADHWIVTPAETAVPEPRPHLQPFPGGTTVPKLPFVIDQGTRYSVAILNTVGPPEDPNVAPEDTEHPPERVLAVRIFDRIDNQKKDKVELIFVDKNNLSDLHVDVDGTANPQRYVAFDIKFDWDYELPTQGRYLIHFQGVQMGMQQPMFSMRVAESASTSATDIMGPIDLEFHRRAIENGVAADEVLTDSLDALPREQWLRFVFQLIPTNANSGTSPQIALWYWKLADGFDSTDPYTHKWVGDWGVPPDPAITNSDKIQYALGVYRRSHERTQGIQLRNIRYGHNYADVTP
ncbi:MAG: hypothetical protein M3Q42_13550 [Pseudomonadota bacterium]|nr:hypothetical protein [Pseudomonadota bacterium]